MVYSRIEVILPQSEAEIMNFRIFSAKYLFAFIIPHLLFYCNYKKSNRWVSICVRFFSCNSVPQKLNYR